MRGRCRGRGGSEHGAAAVEMALVLPLLILLIGGVIDFGFMFNAQISATHAAREGVRVEAIGTGDAAQAAENAFFAPAATSLGAQIVRSCPHDDGALLRMRASYDFFFLPFGQRTLTGEAVMRCNG
jgi:Flp pilus assembly protein TadG